MSAPVSWYAFVARDQNLMTAAMSAAFTALAYIVWVGLKHSRN